MPQIGSASSVLPSDLLGFTRFLCNILDNYAAFSDTNITALLNLEYRETQSFLLSQLMYDWKENATDGTGTGLKNLVAGTNSYIFPTDLMTIDRVEINYTGATNGWVEANPIKLEAMGKAVSNTSGNALIRFSTSNPHYWVRDGYIYLDPIPSQSVTSGLKFWCTTIITDLAVGGTGDALTPVFSSSFHHLLCYKPAATWLRQKGEFVKAREMEMERERIRQEMVKFYIARQTDERSRLSVKTRDLR